MVEVQRGMIPSRFGRVQGSGKFLVRAPAASLRGRMDISHNKGFHSIPLRYVSTYIYIYAYLSIGMRHLNICVNMYRFNGIHIYGGVFTRHKGMTYIGGSCQLKTTQQQPVGTSEPILFMM